MDPSAPTGAPGDEAQWSATLRGLSRIRKDVTHDVRSRVHGLALQAEIMGELVPDSGADSETWAHVRNQSRSLAVSLRSLGEEFEDLIVQLDIEPGEATAIDLALALHGSTRWLTTFARRRGVGWTVRAPESGVLVRAALAGLRRALFLLACDAIERASTGANLELALAPEPPDAVLTIVGLAAGDMEFLGGSPGKSPNVAVGPDESAPGGADLAAVRDALAGTGARIATTVRMPGAGHALEMRWPLATDAN